MLGAVETERLQKLIARAGIASRRRAEELIVAGRVRVNGRVAATLGARADPHRDRIDVDGRRLVFDAPVTYVLYKPRGVVTTLSDPEGRRTVVDIMRKVRRRVFPVGRLGFHTAGALILTSDGPLAHGLLRPRNLVPRVYRAKIKGGISDETLARLTAGVDLGLGSGGGAIRAARAYRLGVTADNTWLSLTVHTGRSDQIERLCEVSGLRLMRLTRVAFGDVSVEGMRPGDYRLLGRGELAGLRRYARLPDPRTRTLPPPPGWEESPPEEARGEEDDGTWAAWDEGSLWEWFAGTPGAIEQARVAEGVVRRGRSGPAAVAEPVPHERDAAEHPVREERFGRIDGTFDDDGWEVAAAGAGGAVRDHRVRGPQREGPGRQARAFRSDRRFQGAAPPKHRHRQDRDERRSEGGDR